MKTAIKYIISKEKGENLESIIVKSSQDAATFCRQFYHDDIGIYESFFIALLNRANKITGYVKISQGGIVGTVVDPILVAKYAIDSLCKSIILCHNHPSGTLAPSQPDKDITNKIKAGLKLFDVNVLDHIILTEDDFYSFLDNDLI